MASKYLVINNKFLYNTDVETHREIIPEGCKLKPAGGGRIHINHNLKEIYLYDRSDEFGTVTRKDILSAIERTEMPEFIGYKIYATKGTWYTQAIEEAKKQLKPDMVYGVNLQTP